MIRHATVRRDLLLAEQTAGIDSARVEFKGRTESSYDHYEDYGCVDICLDTYPYNGTTTTCDSLIMGVPVITLAGTSHPSRVSASLLATVGLQQLVASSPDQYVEIATQLASDLVVLNSLRSGLREDMRSSPLMDYPEFTRHLEHEYRIIWRHWCEHGCTKPRLC